MARTRKQLLTLAKDLPVCTATVIYRFEDGWTIRHLKTRGDEHREGVLAGHCWHHTDALTSGWAGDHADYFETPLAEEDPYEAGDRTKSYSLRDADNIPRASFYLDQEVLYSKGWAKSGRLHLNEAFGHHSSDPKEEYRARLVSWAGTLEQEVVFSARYFTGSRRIGSVELINERDWRARTGESAPLDVAELIAAGDHEGIQDALECWAADAPPGDIRVVGSLLVG